MNTKVTIVLKEYDKIKKFINEVVKFDSDVDLVKGSYTVDSKSIMGIFTVDLSEPVDVVIHSDNEEEVKRFNEVMKEFI